MKIKAYIKRPGEVPYSADVENSLESLQNCVGGCIETVTIATDLVIICNEEGRLENMPYNCEVRGVDFVGDILFVGVDGDEFCDVPMSFKDFKKCFRRLWELANG